MKMLCMVPGMSDTKTHQPEPTKGLLSGHANVNSTMTLAKPLLMASFFKEEEDVQSNFWPWSTKLVTETEYKSWTFSDPRTMPLSP